MLSFIVPLFLRERLLFKSASLREREFILLSVHSISVFLLEWRVFYLDHFHSGNLLLHSYRGESFRSFTARLFALCGDPQPALLIINTLDLKLTLHLCPVSRGLDTSMSLLRLERESSLGHDSVLHQFVIVNVIVLVCGRRSTIKVGQCNVRKKIASQVCGCMCLSKTEDKNNRSTWRGFAAVIS